MSEVAKELLRLAEEWDRDVAEASKGPAPMPAHTVRVIREAARKLRERARQIQDQEAA